MTFTVRPLTPDLWPQLEELFGPNGACGGCWCMWWRVKRSEFKPVANKTAFKRLVMNGPPPGLLAFDGETPVGWCQLTPRSSLVKLSRSRLLAPVDDLPVWAVSCFFVRRGHRRKGVTADLIAAAIAAARQAGAPALEAYPTDTKEKMNSTLALTGLASTFRRAGFKTVARRAAQRPIMRHDLKSR